LAGEGKGLDVADRRDLRHYPNASIATVCGNYSGRRHHRAFGQRLDDWHEANGSAAAA